MLTLIPFAQVNWDDYLALVENNRKELEETNAIGSLEDEKEDTLANNPNRKYFAIILRKRLIGKIGIHHIKDCPQISLWIGKKYQGRGYGKEALAQLLDFVFRDLKLDFLLYNTYCFNQKSTELAKRLNFSLRNDLLMDEDVDEINMFLMYRWEWESIQEQQKAA